MVEPSTFPERFHTLTPAVGAFDPAAEQTHSLGRHISLDLSDLSEQWRGQSRWTGHVRNNNVRKAKLFQKPTNYVIGVTMATVTSHPFPQC